MSPRRTSHWGLAVAGMAAAGLVAVLSAAGGAQDDRRTPTSMEEVRLSFAPVVQQASPAVVNVFSTRVVRQRSPFDDMFGPGFDGMFGMPRQRLAQSLGSGVLVGEDGIVVTNNHVVEGGVELRVVLNDRREFPAELVLTDARTDLAVLRIDPGPAPLPTLDFGASAGLQVGDLVLAIGNPFGVGQTVTQGIVSALARTDVGMADAQSFIQTDAAINPGNSGGALVDLDGRLVGINTAIFSRSGGSNGIGFAIPVEIVERVVEAAVEGGRVERPWIGAGLQEVTPDIAASLGLERPTGLLLTDVFDGGPADRARLRSGDVLLRLGGQEVNDPAGLRFELLTHRIGDLVEAAYFRDGRERSGQLRIALPPEDPPRDQRVLSGRHPLDGAEVANLSPAVNSDLGADLLRRGVAVMRLSRSSASALSGLRIGDVILEVNGVAVETSGQLERVLRQNEGSRRWSIVYDRDGVRSTMLYR